MNWSTNLNILLNEVLTEEDKSLINYKILDTANQLMNKIYSIVKDNSFLLDKPLINITEQQEIVLEWWNKNKKITIYISDKTIDYIKIWGANMDNEMEYNSIDLPNDFTTLVKEMILFTVIN